VNAKIARTFFHGVDRFLKRAEPLAKYSPLRRRALARAAAWMLERFSDSEGLSAILPAMSNSILAASCLGYPHDGALIRRELEHLDALLLRDGESGAVQMQPCLSPVWDTVLAAHALIQCGTEPQHPALRRAASWLLAKQCRVPGDWEHRNAALPGGWYFENLNERYPDVDDTCMALMVLQRARAHEPESVQRDAVARGLAWMLGMQNRDGGFASFDRDNDKRWLTFIPFADHNAMIDPSTADITGRVLESLSYFPQFDTTHPVVRRAVAFLRKDQQADGSWFGRWGVNHIYGTWQVLRGLSAIGADMSEPWVGNAAEWLLAHQNEDGGWGESIASYADASQRGRGPSNPAQTAWGLMGLLAVQTPDHAAVRRAVAYLLEQQDSAGTWRRDAWVGTGFPRVFYLNYHGYAHYFPLMALGQYRRAHSEAVAPRRAAARAAADSARRPA
jgi:squalene-hopene/tetraprenyl-beta-curcumene cyclase